MRLEPLKFTSRISESVVCSGQIRSKNKKPLISGFFMQAAFIAIRVKHSRMVPQRFLGAITVERKTESAAH